MREICLTMILSADLRDQSRAERLLTLIRDTAPALFPERVGNYEPLRTRIDGGDIQAALRSWGSPFLWLRRTGEVDGSVFVPFRNGESSWINLGCRAGEERGVQMANLMRSIAAEFEPVFGAVTLLSDSEIARGTRNDSVFHLDKQRTKFSFSVSKHHLRVGIPDVYWLTVLGPPIVRLIGDEQVRTVPVHSVKEIAADTFVLQLSPSLDDVGTRAAEIDAIRDRAIAHLGADVFGSAANPARRVVSPSIP